VEYCGAREGETVRPQTEQEIKGATMVPGGALRGKLRQKVAGTGFSVGQ